MLLSCLAQVSRNDDPTNRKELSVVKDVEANSFLYVEGRMFLHVWQRARGGGGEERKGRQTYLAQISRKTCFYSTSTMYGPVQY